MKVLIMGVNGFIGDALATYYSNKGHNVYGIARRQSENKKNDIKIYIKNLENENITGLLEEVRPDIILHCAGSASVATSLKDPLYDFDKNIGILYKTLLSLKESGVNSRFVFLSSAAVYGNPNELPIKETHTISPISPYGLHKKVCEDICKYFHQIEKMDLLIARIFSTYGEGLKKQILWDCHKKIKKTNRLELFGTGDETRDFIHIDDLVNSIDLIVNYKNENLDIPTFNIASGKEVKIRDIAFTFASAYGLNKSKIFFNNKSKDGDPLRWKADISKITNLGFSHQVSLVEGINKYVDWVKNIEKK
ncbi:NAD-dependent epimerase/dehydratase family protein [Bacillus sp. V3]|nr:NAD-dependent epimerase/dehydratase family protein [Bacillus sp. V3]